MPTGRLTLLLFSTAVLLLGVAHGCAPGDKKPEKPGGGEGDGDGDDGGDDGDDPDGPSKPSWWPDPEMYPQGWGWPPPPPPGWGESDPFPPTGVDLEDVQWWIDRYGVDFDPTQPGPGGAVRPEQDGSDGDEAFSKSFERVLVCAPQYVPGCGMFVIDQWADLHTCREGGCTPYPAADMNRLCRDALDAQTAEAACRTMCQRNRQRCRLHRLFTPALYAHWSCDQGAECPGGLGCGVSSHCEEAEDSCPNDLAGLECRAYFLCSCWES